MPVHQPNNTSWSRLNVVLAAAAGASIAAVDSFASGGEVSPIVVVVLLFTAGMVVAALGGRRPWLVTLLVWMWLPMAHVAKHALGLPDTIQPNTPASIALLGAFSLAVTVVGTGCGVLVRPVLTSLK